MRRNDVRFVQLKKTVYLWQSMYGCKNKQQKCINFPTKLVFSNRHFSWMVDAKFKSIASECSLGPRQSTKKLSLKIVGFFWKTVDYSLCFFEIDNLLIRSNWQDSTLLANYITRRSHCCIKLCHSMYNGKDKQHKMYHFFYCVTSKFVIFQTTISPRWWMLRFSQLYQGVH